MTVHELNTTLNHGDSDFLQCSGGRQPLRVQSCHVIGSYNFRVLFKLIVLCMSNSKCDLKFRLGNMLNY